MRERPTNVRGCCRARPFFKRNKYSIHSSFILKPLPSHPSCTATKALSDLWPGTDADIRGRRKPRVFRTTTIGPFQKVAFQIGTASLLQTKE